MRSSDVLRLARVHLDERADQPVDADRARTPRYARRPLLRADQRGRVDELVGDRVVGLLALAVEVQRLHLVGDLAEAEAVREVDVEVRLPRAHPAQVEQQARLDHGPGRLEVAVDRHLHGRRDLEVLARAAALREAGLEVLAPGLLEGVGREEDRDPAVADLGRHLDRLAADRADEDGDLVADGMEVELQRLALAGDALALGRSCSARPECSSGPSRAMISRTTSMYSRVLPHGFA